MRKLVVTAMLGLCAIALPASASTTAPAYMTCVFTNSEGAKSEVKITVDEAAGAVSILVPSTGYSTRLAGAFSADRVVFRNSSLDYSISRVDLSATRTIRQINSTDKGKCIIEPPPKRAF